MKTGYDQHFKKVKQSSKALPSLNAKNKSSKDFSSAIPETGSRTLSSQQKKVKKTVFPIMPLMSFIFISLMGLLFLENFESIELYLKKIEVGFDIAEAAEETQPARTSSVQVTPSVTGQSKNGVIVADQKADVTDAKKIDDADYLFKLAERKKQLDQREEDLKKFAEQIEKQKIEIEEKLAKLEETRLKISKALEEKIKTDDGKVETLVQMYSSMKPAQAAKVFESLDEDLVIEILGRMKKKNAADILNLIKPEKAQLFAERYAGYRAPANTNK